jgi:phage baseplate assembly protein gpV
VIEDVLELLESKLGAMHEKLPGVVVGKVSSVDDPMTLGRVQVKIPAIDSSDPAPWARVAVPMAGSEMGVYFLPRVDDEVLVAFEHGSPQAPYVIGCLWNANNPPPLPSPQAEIRKIKTPAGIEIILADRPTTVTISTSNNEKIEIATDGITIETGSGKIVVGAKESSIKLTAGANSIELASGGITIDASPNLTLKASGTVDIQGQGSCSVQAPVVKIN